MYIYVYKYTYTYVNTCVFIPQTVMFGVLSCKKGTHGLDGWHADPSWGPPGPDGWHVDRSWEPRTESAGTGCLTQSASDTGSGGSRHRKRTETAGPRHRERRGPTQRGVTETVAGPDTESDGARHRERWALTQNERGPGRDAESEAAPGPDTESFRRAPTQSPDANSERADTEPQESVGARHRPRHRERRSALGERRTPT